MFLENRTADHNGPARGKHAGIRESGERANGIKVICVITILERSNRKMSFRSTIAVYYKGKAADIRYYRNWDPLNLLFEAFATASVASGCAGWRAYRFMIREALGQDTENYSDEEEDDIIRFYEEASEYPIIVDVTARRIYLQGSERDDRYTKVFDRINENINVTELLSGSGVRFSRKMLESFRRTVLSDIECRNMISKTMGDIITGIEKGKAV